MLDYPMRRQISKIIFVILLKLISPITMYRHLIGADASSSDHGQNLSIKPCSNDIFNDCKKAFESTPNFKELSHTQEENRWNIYIYFSEFLKITDKLMKIDSVDENISAENFSKCGSSEINFNHKLKYYTGINLNTYKLLLQKYSEIRNVNSYYDSRFISINSMNRPILSGIKLTIDQKLKNHNLKSATTDQFKKILQYYCNQRHYNTIVDVQMHLHKEIVFLLVVKRLLENQKQISLLDIGHTNIKPQKLVSDIKDNNNSKYEITSIISLENDANKSPKESFKCITSINELYNASDKVHIETLFNNKLFFEAYKKFAKKDRKSSKTKRLMTPGKKLSSVLKSQLFHVLILKNFWMKIRASFISVEDMVSLWNCLAGHFITNNSNQNTKNISNDNIFICFCASIISHKNNKQLIKFLSYGSKNSTESYTFLKYKNSTSSEKCIDINDKTEYALLHAHSYFELNNIVDENKEFNLFHTFSYALSTLTSKISEKIIFQNIRKMYYGTYQSKCHEMYFHYIYHIVKTVKFTEILKELYLSNIKNITSSDLRLSCIVNELNKNIYKMHKDVCALFNQLVIPYLNDISERKVLSQKIKDNIYEKSYARCFKKKRYIKNYICKTLVKWFKLIDEYSFSNAEVLKYNVYINCFGILKVYQTIYTLVFILTGPYNSTDNPFNFHLLFEYIIFSQFNFKKVELFFDEYEQFCKVNSGNVK